VSEAPAQQRPVDRAEPHQAGEAPSAGTVSAGTLAIVLLALIAAAASTAFGLWSGPGHRLLKLEAALALSAVGLAVVALAPLARPAAVGSTDSRNSIVFAAPLIPFAAALLSMAAALIHFAVIKQHLDSYWLYGAFFVVVGFGQLCWGLLVVWRPSPIVYWLGALGNASVAVFFVITRTIGTLIGPEASAPAQLGFGDTAATAYEVMIVLLAASLLTGTATRFRAAPASAAGGGALLSLLVMPQTALALQSAVSSAPFVPHAG
jgi:hypothetical protein